MPTPLKRLALVLVPVLLSSCIVIKEKSVIHEDLTMENTIVMDFSALMELGEMSEAETQQQTLDLQEVCDKAKTEAEAKKTENPAEWKTMECKILSDTSIQLKGTVDFTKADTLTKTTLPDGSVQYRYSVKDGSMAESLQENSSMEDSPFSEEEMEALQETSKGIVSVMYNISISVTMPGEITKADGATSITSNTAFYDHDALMELTETQDLVIESIVKAGTVATGANMKDRVCARIAKFADKPDILARVTQRISKRFGFTCSGQTSSKKTTVTPPSKRTFTECKSPSRWCFNQSE